MQIILSPTELRTRIHNLARKYRSEKNLMGKSGGSRSTWAYFEELNAFLQGYKQNNLTEMMDESIGPESDNVDEDMENQDDVDNVATGDLEIEYLDEDSEYCAEYTQAVEHPSSQSPSQGYLNINEPASSSTPSSSSGRSNKPSKRAPASCFIIARRTVVPD